MCPPQRSSEPSSMTASSSKPREVRFQTQHLPKNPGEAAWRPCGTSVRPVVNANGQVVSLCVIVSPIWPIRPQIPAMRVHWARSTENEWVTPIVLETPPRLTWYAQRNAQMLWPRDRNNPPPFPRWWSIEGLREFHEKKRHLPQPISGAFTLLSSVVKRVADRARAH